MFILSFLMLITFLVYFHELGHYLTARLFKVKVEKFSIGFGKPL
ncbi:MAG: RIP metalloprotease RseP, partial [Hellea sp.]|nr:RIP metalloprotease RseP [Hellea sp.]